MNVDIDNFNQKRLQIQNLSLIQKSEYISFDLEFTGVKFQNNQRERSDMFLNQKYNKMALVATKFNIIQIGITFILPDQKNHKQYIAYPYNIYVFPRESSLGDPVISLQAGCVQFNTNQNMDWNRWIKKGINYVKMAEIDKISNPDSRTYDEMMSSLDDTNKNWVRKITFQFQEMNEKKPGNLFQYELPKMHGYIVKKTIEKFSSENNLRWLVTINYRDQILEDDKMAVISIKKLTPQQFLESENKKYEALIGFTLIFREIWEAKKKLIGHNCLYDILFIYEAFINHLPTEYNNFKKSIADHGQFYDTKYMISQMDEKDKIFPKGTSLEEAFKYYYKSDKQNKVLKLAPNFEGYDLSNQILHEAGFDSYLTAWVFFQILPSVNLKECEGKFNIFKSFYFMNIRNECDGIVSDACVFVIPVASYNKFIPLEELRKLKYQESKNLRNLFNKEGVMKYLNVSEGLKEIFIYPKQKIYNETLIKTLNKFKREKQIFGVRSLSEWIKFRNEGKDQENH